MASFGASDTLHLNDRLASVETELRNLNSLITLVQEQGIHLPHPGELELVKKRLERSLGQRVDPLRDQVGRLRTSAEPAGDRWRELDGISQRLENLADELMPVAYGALARAAGVDHGVCALAEELVADLAILTAGGERVVVPAPRDHTSSGMWVIRLAVHDGVWSLPIVAHELGHVVAADLVDEHGQRLGYELLNGSWRTNTHIPSQAAADPGFLPYSRANELFADIFAAYCVGPAYAAALMSRSVPVDAWKVRYDHPPFAARLRAVLFVLRDIDASWVCDLVQADWNASLAAIGELDDPPPDIAGQIDTFTDAGCKVMRLTASRSRFEGEEVISVGKRLRIGQPPALNTDLRTTINAAWAERLRDRSAIDKIEQGLRAWLDIRVQPLVALS